MIVFGNGPPSQWTQANTLRIGATQVTQLFEAIRIPWSNRPWTSDDVEKAYVVEALSRHRLFTEALETVERARSLSALDAGKLLITAEESVRRVSLGEGVSFTRWMQRSGLPTNVDGINGLVFRGYERHPTFWAAREYILKTTKTDAPTVEAVLAGERAALVESDFNLYDRTWNKTLSSQESRFAPTWMGRLRAAWFRPLAISAVATSILLSGSAAVVEFGFNMNKLMNISAESLIPQSIQTSMGDLRDQYGIAVGGVGGKMGDPDERPRFHRIKTGETELNTRELKPLFKITQSRISVADLPIRFDMTSRRHTFELYLQVGQNSKDSDFTLESVAPLLSSGRHVSIPAAEGYRMQSFVPSIATSSGELKPIDNALYTLSEDRVTGLIDVYFFSFASIDMSKVRIRMGYTKDPEYESNIAMLPAMTAAEAALLAHDLREKGYSKLSATIEKEASSAGALTLPALAQAVASSSIYPYDFRATHGSVPDFESRDNAAAQLNFLSQFVVDGAYIGQCTGADLLLRSVLHDAYTLMKNARDQRFSRIEDFSVAGFTRSPGEIILTATTTHQHTVIYDQATQRSIVLDATSGGPESGHSAVVKSRQEQLEKEAIQDKAKATRLAESAKLQLSTQFRDEVALSAIRPPELQPNLSRTVPESSLPYVPVPPVFNPARLREMADDSRRQKLNEAQIKIDTIRGQLVHYLRESDFPVNRVNDLPSRRLIATYRLLQAHRDGTMTLENLWLQINKIYPGVVDAKNIIPNWIESIARYEEERHQQGFKYIQNTRDQVSLIAYTATFHNLIVGFTEAVFAWSKLESPSRIGGLCTGFTQKAG